jgi:hypothetical protein
MQAFFAQHGKASRLGFTKPHCAKLPLEWMAPPVRLAHNLVSDDALPPQKQIGAAIHFI